MPRTLTGPSVHAICNLRYVAFYNLHISVKFQFQTRIPEKEFLDFELANKHIFWKAVMSEITLDSCKRILKMMS